MTFRGLSQILTFKYQGISDNDEFLISTILTLSVYPQDRFSAYEETECNRQSNLSYA